MPSWPSVWRVRALESAGIPANKDTLAIIKAWHDSTPLPVLTNNPIGMPAGSSGAPKYLHTKYAIFPSMSYFYAAFATFIASSDGRAVAQAMTSKQAYSATWRKISDLHWPGSITETDYPAALLDLTTASYRDSVKASDPSERKTSGQVGKDPISRNAIIAQARSTAQASRTFADSTKAVRHLIRKHGSNG